jgi:hypothetical protein
MASLIYNSYKLKLIDSSTKIDLSSDTIKLALVTSTYVPSADNHDFFNDITNEVVGTGYTAGGATLASKTTTQDNTNDRAVFDAADVSWTTSSITARGAVLYKSTGVASTSPIIGYIDFGTDKTSDGGTFQITFSVNGILTIS